VEGFRERGDLSSRNEEKRARNYVLEIVEALNRGSGFQLRAPRKGP